MNKVFKPTWLYIKQHNSTGLKYFGKTIKADPLKYTGSGKYWKLHLKAHGQDVSTIWYQLFTDEQSLVNYAINFSKEHNISESKDWANLKFEDGLEGGFTGTPRSEITKRKLSLANTGKVHPDETRHKISESNKGKHSIPKTKEAIEKIKDARRNQVMESHSEITKIKMSSSWINRAIVECPHCQKSSKNVSVMNRYHFDNCKFNTYHVTICL